MSPRQLPSSTPARAAAPSRCGSRRAEAAGSAPPCSSADRVRVVRRQLRRAAPDSSAVLRRSVAALVLAARATRARRVARDVAEAGVVRRPVRARDLARTLHASLAIDRRRAVLQRRWALRLTEHLTEDVGDLLPVVADRRPRPGRPLAGRRVEGWRRRPRRARV